ncbi:MAG: four helix bundle protein [Bacteroidales bacterium]|nr:four helix bundle protein [Bacteroidales bacterium]
MGHIIRDRSFDFALRIIKLYSFLTDSKKEYVLSKQILKSGTSIGANIREARNAQSNSDFISKYSIALKEADETQYWIELLYASEFIDDNAYKSLNDDINELISLLISSIKTAKNNGK